MSSIPARMKKIQLKMKALECSQDFSHYKSMGIFPDAQGQLTPQPLVRSGRINCVCLGGGGGGVGVDSILRRQSRIQSLKWYNIFSWLFGSLDNPLIMLEICQVKERNSNYHDMASHWE